MSGKKETYVYGSLKERFILEWKIYALAFARLAISDQLKTFVSQGLKILIVGIFVMTGTFLGSCLWDQMLLNLAGVI